MTYWVHHYSSTISTVSQVWGQCCRSHSTECLCDIAFAVVMLHMVSGGDWLRYESGSEDELPVPWCPSISVFWLLQSLMEYFSTFCRVTASYERLDKKRDKYLYYYYWKARWENFVLGKWEWQVCHDGTDFGCKNDNFETRDLFCYVGRLF